MDTEIKKEYNPIKEIFEICEKNKITFVSNKGKNDFTAMESLNMLPLLQKELIDEETADAVENLKFIPIYQDKRLMGKKELFDKNLARVLDFLTIEIQEKLQSHRYFMPSKADPSRGWKQ